MDAADEAITEALQIPPNKRTTRIDFFPFYYRREGEERREVLKEGIYLGFYARFWWQGETLYMTDRRAVLTIPATAMESCVLYDAPLVADMCWRENEPSAAEWAALGVTEDKQSHYHIPGYIELTVRADDGTYTLRFPSYELSMLQKLLADVLTIRRDDGAEA